MRNFVAISLISWILILTQTCDASDSTTSINDILQTDRYMLVAQQDNHRLFETNIALGKCPKTVTNLEREKSINYRYVGFHLVRDVKEKFPPKILSIAENQKFYRYQFMPLNASRAFEAKNSKSPDYFSERSDLYYLGPFGVRGRNQGNLVNSVFDTSTYMLYLDYSTTSNYNVEQYFVNDIFNEKPDMTFIKRYTGRSLKRRYDFVEDPYSKKLYYKENIDNQTQYFKANLNDAVQILSGTITGNQVALPIVLDSLLGVSNGTFYGTRVAGTEGINQEFTLFNLNKTESIITCKIETKRDDFPQTNKLIIIRGYDYCILRNGTNYNKQKCYEEQNHYFENRSEPEFNVTLWLTVFCVVLLATVILLCIYVYWLRTSFVTTEERDVPNEQETEASVFIAKQRSFPTSYQDPALLDISVDRWN